MKILSTFLVGCTLAMAQQVCYTPNNAKPASVACMTVTPAMLVSLNAFIATQLGPSLDGGKTPGAPLYKGVADLLFQNLTKGLFAALVAMNPPAPVATAQAALASAQTALDTAKAAAIPVPAPATDPQ